MNMSIWNWEIIDKIVNELFGFVSLFYVSVNSYDHVETVRSPKQTFPE